MGKDWKIDSLAFRRTVSVENEKPVPQVEWQFTHQQIPARSQLSFVTNSFGEVLLLDNTENILYQLSQKKVGVSGSDLEPEVQERSSETGSNFLVLFIFSVVAGAFYLIVKRSKFSAKTYVRRQYSRIELSESKQQIQLYRRHESDAEVILELSDIVSSEIQLNDIGLSFINCDEGHGFDRNKEQDLRTAFTKEHVHKMVDGKVRQVSLQLVDKQKQNFIICLYMRKGSNRITKKNYFTVVDDLIDWSWLISGQLNPVETAKREVSSIEKFVETEKGHAEEENAVPLHDQAEAIRATTHKAPSQTSLNETNETNSQIDTKVETKEPSMLYSHEIEHKNVDSAIDTELVNALEKLVNLKQQGFLTLEEFDQAKAKLLKNLFDKD